MTPKGKKTAIIITSLLAIGGVIGYFLWRHKKNKKEIEEGTVIDKVVETTNPSVNDTISPKVVVSKPIKQVVGSSSNSQSSVSQQSAYGFKKGEKLYPKMNFDNAYSYPSKDKRNIVGKILRDGGKNVAVYVGDSSVKGWIKAKAVVTGYKFNQSTNDYDSSVKEVYLEAKNYTNVAP